jgi:hypothetical protein
MSSLKLTVSPLRQRMIDDMRMRKLDGKTQIHCIRDLRRLAAFLKQSPDRATWMHMDVKRLSSASHRFVHSLFGSHSRIGQKGRQPF